MKINIHSFVRGANHGQFFQALGLKDLVESIIPNADVRHVYNNNHSFSEIKGHLKSFSIHKYVAFQYWWHKYLNFNHHTSPDIEIYGSDMIWYPQSDIFPFDITFFGVDNEIPRISYAPSAGPVAENFYNKKVSDSLKLFRCISVRDYNTKDFVKRHCDVPPQMAIDPSFFIRKRWRNGKVVSNRAFGSALVYSSRDQSITKDLATNLMSNNKISSYQFFGYHTRAQSIINASQVCNDPLLFFKEAEKSQVIITDTFHGVMVALITKTPFIAIKNPSLMARLDSPLLDFFSHKRLINTVSELDCFYVDSVDDIDFIKIEVYMKNSRNFLANSLRNEIFL
jgi:hypothetical protein